jgi:hypothetical protein
MAFKTFTPGVLTSSDVNTFLMRQAVIVCTSTTRPASPNEGMTIYETDSKRYLGYTGTAWRNISDLGVETYTPVLGGAGWIYAGTEVVLGRYVRSSDWVHGAVRIVWQGGTTAGTGSATISLPVSSLATLGAVPFGQVRFRDISANISYPGLLLRDGGTTAAVLVLADDGTASRQIQLVSTTAGAQAGGYNFPRDATDIWTINFSYQVA